MVKEETLSDKIETYKDKTIITSLESIKVSDIRDFIKKQIDRMNNRISFFDDLRGLAEAELQRAEVIKIRDDLIKDAGERFK